MPAIHQCSAQCGICTPPLFSCAVLHDPALCSLLSARHQPRPSCCCSLSSCHPGPRCVGDSAGWPPIHLLLGGCRRFLHSRCHYESGMFGSNIITVLGMCCCCGLWTVVCLLLMTPVARFWHQHLSSERLVLPLPPISFVVHCIRTGWAWDRECMLCCLNSAAEYPGGGWEPCRRFVPG